jgi:hypothetical protein
MNGIIIQLGFSVTIAVLDEGMNYWKGYFGSALMMVAARLPRWVSAVLILAHV